jgi:hypothetical protein
MVPLDGVACSGICCTSGVFRMADVAFWCLGGVLVVLFCSVGGVLCVF